MLTRHRIIMTKAFKTFGRGDVETRQIMASARTLVNVCYLPVCRKRWFLRLVCLLNPRLQMWHLKGQEPLWTYMWDLRSPGVGKDLEHSPHLWGFSCNRNMPQLSEEPVAISPSYCRGTKFWRIWPLCYRFISCVTSMKGIFLSPHYLNSKIWGFPKISMEILLWVIEMRRFFRKIK